MAYLWKCRLFIRMYVRSRSWTFTSRLFLIKELKKVIYNQDPWIDLVHIWYDGWYRSKHLFSITRAHPRPISAPDIGHFSSFLRCSFKKYSEDPSIDLFHIRCDGRYRSKLLFSSTPIQAHNLKVKVTDRCFHKKEDFKLAFLYFIHIRA